MDFSQNYPIAPPTLISQQVPALHNPVQLSDLPPPPPLTLPIPILVEDLILQKLMQTHQHNYSCQQEQMSQKHKRIEELDPSLIINKVYTEQELIKPTQTSELSQCVVCNNWIKSSDMKHHISLHATLILDGLYLGASNNASNLKELKRLKIGSILNCANEIPNTFVSDKNFTYKKLTLNDVIGESIKILFEQCFSFINQSLMENKSVLVHCAMGKSRSATIIIAYLMVTNRLSLKEAYDYVKEKRPQIAPNPSYIKDLIEFEKQLYGRNSMKPEEVLPVYKYVSLW